jgi:hypothetical protein
MFDFGCFSRISFLIKIQLYNIIIIGSQINILVINNFGIIVMIFELFIFIYIFIRKEKNQKPNPNPAAGPTKAQPAKTVAAPKTPSPPLTSRWATPAPSPSSLSLPRPRSCQGARAARTARRSPATDPPGPRPFTSSCYGASTSIHFSSPIPPLPITSMKLSCH